MLTEAILLEQNKRLRAENDELRETVRQVRTAALGIEPLPADLPVFTPMEERIFRLLLSRPVMFSREQVRAVTNGADTDSTSVYIHRIRRRLRGFPYRLETTWGRGYTLVRAAAAQ